MDTIENRIILACQELVSGDKFARSVYALLTGKRIDDSKYIEQKIQATPEKALALLSEIEGIIQENSDSFPSGVGLTISNLKNAVNHNGVIAILSGPSASGKDQLVVNCIDMLEADGISTDIIRKYSTRAQRNGEVILDSNDVDGKHLDKTSSYYILGEEWFKDDGDLFFLYEKYSHKYAFSANSIRNSDNSDVQFIVFGDIINYKKFLNKLKKQTSRKIISFLLDVDEDTLHLRQKSRDYLTSKEKLIRIEEMRKDVKLIQKGHVKKYYDMCIPNGRENPICQAEDIIIKEIKTHLKKAAPR